MTDPTNTPSLRQIFSEIERRLRALEGAPQLDNSSLRDGRITILNAAGTRVAEYGKAAGGGYGIAVNEAASLGTLLFVNDADGFFFPALEHAFVAADDKVTVTSGSFVTTHRAVIPNPMARVLRADIVATADVATTGELRVRLSTGETTATKALPAGAQTDCSLRWAHLRDIGSNSTTFVTLEVQARRVSGAGNVFVYRPPSLTQSSIFTSAVGGLT